MDSALFGAVAVLEPDAGHALAQAALFDKLFFQGLELLIDEIIGLMNQANGNVGDGLRWSRFHEFTVKLKSVRGNTAQASDKLCFFGVFVPDDVVAHSQVIAVVGK